MAQIDLNCDLGEGAGQDAALMPWITSANIACGAHAGDEATMRETIALAVRHGVAIGAHPGFADRANFGRREIALSPDELAELVTGQLRVFQQAASDTGTVVSHVKLHGALYNMTARDAAWAAVVAKVMEREGGGAALFVLSGSELERVARHRRSFRVVAEVFADRSYSADGSLTPRGQAGALIEDEKAAVAQALRMVTESNVRATDGTEVAITAETICLHGDGVQAVAFARRLNQELKAAGIALKRI